MQYLQQKGTLRRRFSYHPFFHQHGLTLMYLDIEPHGYTLCSFPCSSRICYWFRSCLALNCLMHLLSRAILSQLSDLHAITWLSVTHISSMEKEIGTLMPPKSDQTNLLSSILFVLMSHEDTSPTIAPPKLQLEPKHTSTSLVRSGVDEELVLPQLHHQSETTRRSIIAAYWIVVVLCLPLWWNLTSIERLSLPTARIERLDKEGNKVRQETWTGQIRTL